MKRHKPLRLRSAVQVNAKEYENLDECCPKYWLSCRSRHLQDIFHLVTTQDRKPLGNDQLRPLFDAEQLERRGDVLLHFGYH